MLDQKTLSELKEALEKEKEILLGELKTIAKPDPNLKGDWDTLHTEMGGDEVVSNEDLESGEEADEVEEDATNENIVQNLEIRLQEVNEALERIREGTYGDCEVCKNPIPLERLKANPAAGTDIEHAAPSLR